MLDAKHKVLYVGKARDLKKRVSSYFKRTHDAPKTAMMMEQVARVEVTVANTEAEALILEYSLIKQHKPRFNILLRDDKSYPYIFASTTHDYPRLKFHRGPRRQKGRYFGPYPSTSAVRQTLSELAETVPDPKVHRQLLSQPDAPVPAVPDQALHGAVREPDLERTVREGHRRRAAVSGRKKPQRRRYLRRAHGTGVRLPGIRTGGTLPRPDCQAQGDRSAPAGKTHQQRGSRHSRFRVERRDSLRHGHVHSQRLRHRQPRSFSAATRPGETDRQKILNAFVAQYYLGRDAPSEIVVETDIEDGELLQRELTQRVGHKVRIRSSVRGDRLRWLQMARTNAEQGLNLKVASNATIKRQFAALGEALQLEEAPQRLECFDVSHTSGEATVASCVVFNTAGPLKSDYRRFNLKPAAAGDDYAAMSEVLRRRYARIKKGEVPMPDVLFVDGGKGQLSEAMKVLEDLGLDWLTVVGVAKGRSRRPGAEQLFRPGESRPMSLPPDSSALLLIQQIRDEAHRFAITGHRQRRAKARRTSKLEEIPGLGPKRRRALLQQFGGLQGVVGAGVDDLVEVRGISRKLAETIYNALHLDG